MTEPFSREDALALFERVVQAEAVRVLFTTLGYAMTELDGTVLPSRFSVLERAETHLPQVLAAYARMPGRTVQLQDVEEKSWALMRTLRTIVEHLNRPC